MPLVFSDKELQGQQVMPPGEYEVRFLGFKPKMNSKGDGINLNPSFEVINNVDFERRRLFDNLSTKPTVAKNIAGFVHCLGVEMESDGKGGFSIPGTFDSGKPEFREDDPSTWEYSGPLTGKTGKVEVTIDNYQGRDNNKIRAYHTGFADHATRLPAFDPIVVVQYGKKA
jgi:hypothetical protein